jgi:hypothetical protein
MKKKLLSKEQLSPSLLTDYLSSPKNIPFISPSTRNKPRTEHHTKVFSFTNTKCNSTTNPSIACPGSDKCPNIERIKHLQHKIQKLKKTNEQLTNMNTSLLTILSHKDSIYKQLLNDNLKMKSHLSFNSPTKGVLISSHSKKRKLLLNPTSSLSSTLNISTHHYHNNNNVNNVVVVPSHRTCHSITTPPKHHHQHQQQQPLTHYDKLSIRSRQLKQQQQQQQPSSSSSSNISFLSATPAQLHQMSLNPIITQLNIISQFEETFKSNITAIPNENLFLYCETLQSLTTDYTSLLKLITRVKAFLQSSINLVESVLLSDSTTALINNTCAILNCERTSLFTYDKFTDSLVIGSAEGVKTPSITVPKDKGIVGYVFTHGEKVKIDDVYKDPRFNKEIDKKTNFITKNMLCYPLKDKNGNTFGAIQSINKRNGHFDIDDLALMDIFSQQASAILQNRVNMHENVTLISKMKVLCKFANEIMGMKSKGKVTKVSEECLQMLFYSCNNKVMFVNRKVNVVEYYNEDDEKETFNMMGVVGYVCIHKEMHVCTSVKKCQHYNNLVDLNSCDCLITVPIMNEANEVVAVMQSVFCGNVNEQNGNIANTEIMLIELYVKCILSWYKANYI